MRAPELSALWMKSNKECLHSQEHVLADLSSEGGGCSLGCCPPQGRGPLTASLFPPFAPVKGIWWLCFQGAMRTRLEKGGAGRHTQMLETCVWGSEVVGTASGRLFQ